jgi:hypothetical protein
MFLLLIRTFFCFFQKAAQLRGFFILLIYLLATIRRQALDSTSVRFPQHFGLCV